METGNVGDLVRAAVARDERSPGAFAELVARFQDTAFSYAFGVLGDRGHAEDATQTAFLRAWLELGQLRDETAFPGWFRAALRTECHRLLRRRAELSAPESPTSSALSADAAARLESAELRERIETAIAELPEDDRVVIRLHYLGERSYRAISEFLDLPVSTVKKRLFTARRRLKEIVSRLDLFEEEVRRSAPVSRPSTNPRFARRVMSITQLLSKTGAGDAAEVARLLDASPELIDARGTWRVGAEDLGTWSALGVAAAAGQIEVARVLLDRGVDVEAPGTSAGPLTVAAVEGHAEVAKLIAARCQSLDVFSAAALGDMDALDAALGADTGAVSRRSGDGKTALHFARSTDVARRLLDAGAEIDAIDAGGHTPLQWISQTGRFKDVRDLLINRGARAEITSIFDACILGDRRAVETLLAKDPECIHAESEDPAEVGSPLVVAAKRGETEIVELLLQEGAEVDAAVGPRGSTALHAAAATGHLDTIRVLLAAGASASAQDGELGATPAEWAELFHQEDCASLLRSS